MSTMAITKMSKAQASKPRGEPTDHTHDCHRTIDSSRARHLALPMSVLREADREADNAWHLNAPDGGDMPHCAQGRAFDRVLRTYRAGIYARKHKLPLEVAQRAFDAKDEALTFLAHLSKTNEESQKLAKAVFERIIDRHKRQKELDARRRKMLPVEARIDRMACDRQVPLWVAQLAHDTWQGVVRRAAEPIKAHPAAYKSMEQVFTTWLERHPWRLSLDPSDFGIDQDRFERAQEIANLAWFAHPAPVWMEARMRAADDAFMLAIAPIRAHRPGSRRYRR